MEKQKLLEWENSRKIELEQHRSRETENVISLRAKKETIGIEFETIKKIRCQERVDSSEEANS